VLNSAKGVFSTRLRPSGPRGPHAVSKALGTVDVGVDTLAGENRCVADTYRLFPVLFRGDGRT
jgi:hypothetical protein